MNKLKFYVVTFD